MRKLYQSIFLLTALVIQSYNGAANEPVLNIVSQNLNRFFDDKDDGNNEKIISSKKYRQRIKQLVNKISTEYKFADVIALQEVENKQILQTVSKKLNKKYAENYQTILIEGNDISGIDVGFLVKKSYQVKSVNSLFRNHTYSKVTEKLFSRPPLLINLCLTECLNIINVHLRSMRGLNSSRHRKRVSLKRLAQAETLASWIDNFQHDYPQEKLIIIGDFNALAPSDSHVDSLGTIIGNPDQKHPKWKSPDLIDDDLIDVSQRVKASSRYSYRFKKRKQLLDYLLVSKNLKSSVKSLTFSRIDYKFSDHGALKAQIYFH